MPRGVFVTGTDTGVGKTVVSAALMYRLRPSAPVRYWKPIQTGIEQDDDTAEVSRLASARPEEILGDGVRLERPVSPHLAAQLSGVTISIPHLAARFRQHADSRYWIVEGAGGVLVPVSDREMIVDLIVDLGLPALVVARTAVGTINHTVMTVETLRHRQVGVAGVVMVGPPDRAARLAIERHGNVEVLGELPFFEDLTSEALAAWSRSLDPSNTLIDRQLWT